jgi:hypothetical protein
MLAGTLAYLLLAFSVIREEHLELIEPERVPEMRIADGHARQEFAIGILAY